MRSKTKLQDNKPETKAPMPLGSDGRLSRDLSVMEFRVNKGNGRLRNTDRGGAGVVLPPILWLTLPNSRQLVSQ